VTQQTKSNANTKRERTAFFIIPRSTGEKTLLLN
jgi:hypothetical protein